MDSESMKLLRGKIFGNFYCFDLFAWVLAFFCLLPGTNCPIEKVLGFTGFILLFMVIIPMLLFRVCIWIRGQKKMWMVNCGHRPWDRVFSTEKAAMEFFNMAPTGREYPTQVKRCELPPELQ